MASNSDMFNEKSGAHKHHGMWTHVIHGALMLGMLLPMVAAAAPLGAATLGDGAVQALHMVKDMISGLTSNFGILADMATNAADGQFAAHTWQAGSVHGAASAGAAAHASTAAHAVSSLTPCDQWLSSLSPGELAGLQTDLQGAYGGMSLCEYHDINIMHHGVK